MCLSCPRCSQWLKENHATDILQEHAASISRIKMGKVRKWYMGCQLFCQNKHKQKCERQAEGRMATVPLAIMETSHSVQAEVTEC
jgi:hypothetical protein